MARGSETRETTHRPAGADRGFGKADRLLKRREFLRLSAAGRRLNTRHFVAVFLPGSGDRCRLGVTASRKVGGAVVRNRIKRACREFFRHQRHRLSGSWDVNLIARHAAGTAATPELVDSLDQIFSRIQSHERRLRHDGPHCS